MQDMHGLLCMKSHKWNYIFAWWQRDYCILRIPMPGVLFLDWIVGLEAEGIGLFHNPYV
jgi:hypothetical protein